MANMRSGVLSGLQNAGRIFLGRLATPPGQVVNFLLSRLGCLDNKHPKGILLHGHRQLLRTGLITGRICGANLITEDSGWRLVDCSVPKIFTIPLHGGYLGLSIRVPNQIDGFPIVGHGRAFQVVHPGTDTDGLTLFCSAHRLDEGDRGRRRVGFDLGSKKNLFLD